MTEALSAHDAYLASCGATVAEVRADGVVLDRTVFYARGGGQPGDTGILRWSGGATRVSDTTKSREDGTVLHAVEPGWDGTARCGLHSSESTPLKPCFSTAGDWVCLKALS